MGEFEYTVDKAGEQEILRHLEKADSSFVPSLSSRVDLKDYARKILLGATRFEAWSGGELAGLVAAYLNDPRKEEAFVTSVSVLPERQGMGAASRLMKSCIEHARSKGFRRIGLEVNLESIRAVELYEALGFEKDGIEGRIARMSLVTGEEQQVSSSRDFDDETRDRADHRYAYSFDFEVMHPFMIRSFEPFFRKGSILELGSYKGDFTSLLLPYSDAVTCVEASRAAVTEAREKLGDRVSFVCSTFEEAVLSGRYDNIILTHTLEHVDDSVLVLSRVNDEWLSDAGRLFIVCPNAHAPSRQIAVKMGLIPHCSAVTPAESQHGHKRTYSMDTLERDAVAAGLRVVHRSGIFFKALANFQWDRLLATDIVSKEYLEGCYMLGQQYPDLCASIFILCERGRPGR